MKHELMGFIFGVSLGICGFTITMWQFWLLMLLAALWGIVVGKEKGRD